MFYGEKLFAVEPRINIWFSSSCRRFDSRIVTKDMDDRLITWLLLAICVPHAFKNPYLVAKIIEVLFVLSTSLQSTDSVYLRIMTHQLSIQYLPPYLMKFYTGLAINSKLGCEIVIRARINKFPFVLQMSKLRARVRNFTTNLRFGII